MIKVADVEKKNRISKDGIWFIVQIQSVFVQEWSESRTELSHEEFWPGSFSLGHSIRTIITYSISQDEGMKWWR